MRRRTSVRLLQQPTCHPTHDLHLPRHPTEACEACICPGTSHLIAHRLRHIAPATALWGDVGLHYTHLRMYFFLYLAGV